LLEYFSFIENRKDDLRVFAEKTEDFSRHRKLDVVHTIGHVLHMVSHRKKNGAEVTSQNYFAELGVPFKSVSRSSLSEARSKLPWESFVYLLDELNRVARVVTWKGHRVRGGDGSHITLPATEEILEQFPRKDNPQSRTHYPKGLLVVATDILTGIPTSAAIGSAENGSERELLASMLDDFEAGDIMLLDRGFEGADFRYEFYKRGQHLIGRVRTAKGCSNQVKEFLKSGKKSADVHFTTSDGQTYKARLVHAGYDYAGLAIVLCTSLVDRSKYSNADIKGLYLKRWNIETMYYRVKQLFSMERFFAKSLNGVFQEIWANLIILGLTALAVHATVPSNEMTAPNFKNASEVVRRNIHYAISLCLTRRRALKKAREMLEQISWIVCRKQTGRKNPRISKQPTEKWNMHRPLTKNRLNMREKRARSLA